MHAPSISLKIKRFRRHFGIGAPRVVVRRHMPWQLLLLVVFFALGLIGSLIWIVHSGLWGSEGQLAELRAQLRLQQDELLALRSTVGTGQNAVSMERAAQQQLLARIRDLEGENASLKEEMLVFERLVPGAGQAQGIRIESFRVFREGARYRYRLLFAFQSAQRGDLFHGRFQVVVRYQVDGREQQLLLPSKLAEAEVEVRHFLRREGVFELPPGGVPGLIEVRVLQGDTLKAKRAARL